MKKNALLALATSLAVVGTVGAARAADEPQLQRLALCQDSWDDWSGDEPRMARFAADLERRFGRGPQGDAFVPRSQSRVLGHVVAEVYPQSVGMGVGFSLVLDADFNQARTALERQLGKPMTCSTSEGVRSCELKLAPKKTALLMTGQNGRAGRSLVGCYYFYQQ